MKQRQGFTLTELVVVISAAAVAGLLLFPALGSARDDGKAAACRNNLRILSEAVQSYAGDYDGMLPVSAAYSTNWPTQQIFMRDGYMRRMDAWVCPAFPPYEYDWLNRDRSYAVIRCDDPDVPPEKDTKIPSHMRKALNYAYDDSGNWMGRLGTYVQFEAVEKPSDFFLIGERVSTTVGVGEFQSAGWSHPNHARNRIHMRHGDITHMLFADGKVGKVDTARLRELGWGRVWTYEMESLAL